MYDAIKENQTTCSKTENSIIPRRRNSNLCLFHFDFEHVIDSGVPGTKSHKYNYNVYLLINYWLFWSVNKTLFILAFLIKNNSKLLYINNKSKVYFSEHKFCSFGEKNVSSG